jgi:cobyrinic acid a,c-diamide synthase
MQILAAQAEKSIDLEGLIELMQAQNPIEAEAFVQRYIGNVRIAVAKDKAFCFYYRDNLEMLEEMGAEIVPFSPIGDEELPDCDGLILGGGYPELYLEQLSRNETMRESIRNAITNGLPTIAECGGFMYLTANIAGHTMVCAIKTNCFNAKKLQRFGYTTISAEKDSLLFSASDTIRAHEFHYWDAENPGGDLNSQKPSGKSWKCVYAADTLYAGYPHLYFPSNPEAAKRFINKCLERKMRHEADGN